MLQNYWLCCGKSLKIVNRGMQTKTKQKNYKKNDKKNAHDGPILLAITSLFFVKIVLVNINII